MGRKYSQIKCATLRSVHVGIGPPNTPFEECCHGFRTYLGHPQLVEDVLAHHPRLRLYASHAGYPFGDEMVALMSDYPNLYVDVAAIAWPDLVPQAAFYAYLQRLVALGFADRIMFGSDYAGAVGPVIEAINAAPFLTHAQRVGILCGNAVKFLRLTDVACGP